MKKKSSLKIELIKELTREIFVLHDQDDSILDDILEYLSDLLHFAEEEDEEDEIEEKDIDCLSDIPEDEEIEIDANFITRIIPDGKKPEDVMQEHAEAQNVPKKTRGRPKKTVTTPES